MEGPRQHADIQWGEMAIWSEWDFPPMAWTPDRWEGVAVTSPGMTSVAIRCHPCVPTSGVALEEWLEERLAELRERIPQAIVRLDRLTQELPSGTSGDGWFLEVQLPRASPSLGRGAVAEVLRDMRLLGLSPTVLAPVSGDEAESVADALGRASFPASDPPAAWNWEPAKGS